MPQTTRNLLTYPAGTDIPSATAFATLAQDIENKIDRYRFSSGSKYTRSAGMYEEKGPNLAGWLMIETALPFVSGNSVDKMLRFEIKGYTYWPVNNVVDVDINFYALNGGVQSPDYHNKGTMAWKDVRIMRNAAGNMCIALQPDNSTSVLQYPKIAVDLWTSWGPEQSDSTIAAMNVIRVTSLTGYTTVLKMDLDSWITPTLYNGWVNYGPGHEPARFRKVGNIVQMQGLIKGGTMGAQCAFLPIRFRPAGGYLIFPAASGGNTDARVDVYPDGTVIARDGSTDWFSLSSVIFPAEG